MSQVSNYSRAIAESTYRDVQAILPRAAQVVQVKGRLVQVQFTEEQEPGETWFPTTYLHVPVGSWGLVHPLRDTAAYFEPVGTDLDDRYYTEAEVDALLALKETHSYSYNTSPGGENLTGVGTYSTAGVLQSGTLQSFIPAITSGLWDVDIEAHALVYRNVATGGVYLFVGNGTSAYQQALGRLSPQTHAYTLNVNVSPSIAGGTALKAVTPSQIIDMRYTGFQTAGTTTVINHGWKITARRVG